MFQFQTFAHQFDGFDRTVRLFQSDNDRFALPIIEIVKREFERATKRGERLAKSMQKMSEQIRIAQRLQLGSSHHAAVPSGLIW